MFENWTWIAIVIGFLMFGGLLMVVRQMSIEDHIADDHPARNTRKEIQRPGTPTVSSMEGSSVRKLVNLVGTAMVVAAVVLYITASIGIFPGDSVAIFAFVLFFLGTFLRSFTRDAKR